MHTRDALEVIVLVEFEGFAECDAVSALLSSPLLKCHHVVDLSRASEHFQVLGILVLFAKSDHRCSSISPRAA